MLPWYTIATIVVGIDLAAIVGFVILTRKLREQNMKLTWKIEEMPEEEMLGDDAIRLVSNN